MLAKARDNAIAKGETKVEEAATYGYKKVNRGFWVHLWRAIAGFGRMILRLTTLISGGATGLVTVPADVVITLMKLADKGFHKIKGFWKWVTGRRGKGRATNAGTLVNEALKGSTTALELLVDLKPSFSAKFLDKVKEKVKKTLSTVGKVRAGSGRREVLSRNRRRNADSYQ